MKLSDIEIETRCFDGNKEIYFHEDHYLSKWWESYNECTKYVYTKDKSENYMEEKCAVLYDDGDQEGYFIVKSKILLEDVEECNKYERYVDLLDFAITFTCEKYTKELLDYLIYYARLDGSRFIRIDRKEDFKDFYYFLEDHYKCIKTKKCYIIRVENPIEIEEYEHLRLYDEDVLSFDEISYLSRIGFIVEKDNIYKNLKIGKLNVSRLDASITFPDCIVKNNEKKYVFNTSMYALVYYIAYNNVDIEKYGFNIEYSIPEVDAFICALGDEKLVVLEEKEVLDNYLDFLLKVKKFTKYRSVEMLSMNYNQETLNWILKKEVIDVSLYIDKLKMCMDLENVSIYAPISTQKDILAFKDKMNSIKSFKIELNSSSYDIRRIDIDFIKEEVMIYYRDKLLKKFSFVGDNKYLNCLKNAYFSNWLSVYKSRRKENPIKWNIVIDFGSKKIKFKGKNNTPKIWKYFIEDLLNCIKINNA